MYMKVRGCVDEIPPMSKSLFRESATATRHEIEEALASLTDVQLVRLQRIAAFRHRSLGSRAIGRNEADLLSDAIIATLEGRRKWKTNVDFMTFLKGVIRSLASHIRTGKAVDAFDDLVPSSANEYDDAADFVEETPTSAPDPELQLLARDFDAQIRDRFKDDRVALMVYEAFLEKMKAAEIQTALGIEEKEYNAAAKRLRRATMTIAKGGQR
jgi:DNA-directed RNA polymerase specialized sigma24 family protein